MHEIKIVKRASLACCAMRPRRAAWDGDTCPTPSARGRCRHAPRSRASRRLGHRLCAFRRRVSAESCRRVCAPRCLLAPPDPAKPAPLRRRDRLPRALRPRLRCCLIRPPPRLLPPRLCLLAPCSPVVGSCSTLARANRPDLGPAFSCASRKGTVRQNEKGRKHKKCQGRIECTEYSIQQQRQLDKITYSFERR